MKHLSMKDIIDYVDADMVNTETLELISNVNAHIGQCEKCRKKLDAYQTMAEELECGETMCEDEKTEFDFLLHDEIAEDSENSMEPCL